MGKKSKSSLLLRISITSVLLSVLSGFAFYGCMFLSNQSDNMTWLILCMIFGVLTHLILIASIGFGIAALCSRIQEKNLAKLSKSGTVENANGKKFKFATVGGFTTTKQVKVVNENNEEIAFVKENLSGDILTASLNITADKKGEEILFSYRNGDFINVYGEVYAKAFRCRKPILLKMSDGREFRLRTNNIWKQYLLIPQIYTLTSENGIEATYKFTVDKSSFFCEIAENSSLDSDVIVMLAALVFFKPLHVRDAKDLSRIINAEDSEDQKDARFIARVSFIFGAILCACWLLRSLALLFD